MEPAKGNKSGQNRATRARTPKQLERQAQVFRMNVMERKTVREIAKELDISQETVISDIRAEAQLRADERAQLREADMAIQVELTERLLDDSMRLADKPGTGALGAAAKAIEMRSKLLGLDAPTKIDAGLDAIMDALNIRPKEAAE